MLSTYQISSFTGSFDMDMIHKDFHDNDIELVAVDFFSVDSIMNIQQDCEEHKKPPKLALN
jgi:hypothetical protein